MGGARRAVPFWVRAGAGKGPREQAWVVGAARALDPPSPFPAPPPPLRPQVPDERYLFMVSWGHGNETGQGEPPPSHACMPASLRRRSPHPVAHYTTPPTPLPPPLQKLTYTDDTPGEYEPPMFAPAADGGVGCFSRMPFTMWVLGGGGWWWAGQLEG